jgi:hypothetical protein
MMKENGWKKTSQKEKITIVCASELSLHLKKTTSMSETLMLYTVEMPLPVLPILAIGFDATLIDALGLVLIELH